jgi:hypothetical protein
VVREIVGVSHRDLKRVRELVERQPALARATIDWGFGDWEGCIDAASHGGNRASVEFLLANGAALSRRQPRVLSDRRPEREDCVCKIMRKDHQLTVADPHVMLTARRD